jgi:hypothetical protein
MIVDLQPLVEQFWIHALIKPSFGTVHQYGESLHSRIETDGEPLETCSSYTARGGSCIASDHINNAEQIKLRRIDGWRKIPAVLSQSTAVAA